MKIGIIADTQYVDADDGSTFDKSTIRRYRNSLKILKRGIAYFGLHNVDYSVLLGDLVDSLSKRNGIEIQCIDEIYQTTKQSSLQWHFCVGNHDLSSMNRATFIEKFISDNLKSSLTSPLSLFYDFCPTKGIRFIFLDCFDVSQISPTNPANKLLAQHYLNKNKNDTSDSAGNWFEGLNDYEKRFVPYNGAVSPTQLGWLQAVLASASCNKEVCFIFSHIPIYQACCRPSGVLWNGEAVMELLSSHNSQNNYGKVVAVIAGHDHDGGYAVDGSGIHHIVPPAPLECNDGEDAFGIITIHELPTNGIEMSESDGVRSMNYFSMDWVGKTPVNKSFAWPSVFSYPN